MNHTTSGLPSLRRSPVWSDCLALSVAVGVLWLVSLVDHAQDVHDAALLLLPGLLLVAGAFAGRVASHVKLPRLTGYIILGALCGPDLLHLVDEHQVSLLKGVNSLAIGLIALMAGSEIHMSWLRKRFKMVLACSLAMTLLTPLAVQQLVLWLPGMFPFMDELAAEADRLWIPALLVGFTILATSPMVVVSVIKDNRSAGPLTELAMGLAVFKDVVVLLGFTLLIALTQGVIRGSAGSEADSLLSVGGQALVHIGVSVAVGLPIGWLLAWLSEREYARFSWLLVGVSLAVTLLQPVLHLEPLFCLLTAGFTAENLWPKRSAWGTHHLERGLSQVAAPVFVVFFVATGLGLDLAGLRAAWPAVLLLTATRIGSYWIALQFGCRLSGVEPQVTRYLTLGVIPQAGVTLGLAAIIGDTFPGWGEVLRDVLIACVALHELIGPVLWTWALKRTGEVGKAVTH